MDEPSEEVRADKVKQFRDIAGDDLDEETCQALLASNDWNVEATTRNFFEGPNSPKYGDGGNGNATTTAAAAMSDEHDLIGPGAGNGVYSSDFDAQATAALQQVFGMDENDDDDEVNGETAAFLGGVRARRGGRGYSPDRDGFNFQQSAATGRTRNSIPPPAPTKSLTALLKEALTGQSGESSASAARRFAAEFDKLVGPDSSAPEFFESSFEDALLSASTERRMLAVYLHSPLHPLTEFYSRDILCSRPVLNALADVRVWGGSVDQAEGYLASTKVQAAGFPCLVLIATDRGRDAKVVDRLYIDDASEPNLAERFAARIAAARNYHPVQQPQPSAPVIDQREVDERRRVVEEQDAALRQAMEDDRRREEEKRARERAEEEERQRKIQEERRKEDELVNKRARIRPEPEASTTEVANIRFQFPGGSKVSRRFNGSDTVGYVRDVLDVHLVDVLKTPNLRYALMLNYPKKTLEDTEVSLKQAGLVPQAVLFLQDLDA